ncbi:MAG: histidine phosphatase family protein [Chloroflexota bacterium]
MKTLLVLRHAKSSWKEADLSDHDRPLNKRGKRDAPRMGELLRQEDLVPDLILSSTAKRARTTAELVAEASGYEGEIQLLRDLYAAGAEAFVEALQHVSSKYDCVMVVGHNPGLEELLEALTGDYETLPTAALGQVQLPVDEWAELREDTNGRLVSIWRPRESGG